MSQRDVYYSLKSTFRSQAESNRTITDIGLMLGLRRCKYLRAYVIIMTQCVILLTDMIF